jgi:hypothetical protein
MTAVTKIWPFAGIMQSPLSDSNRRPLPYHGRFTASRAFTDAHERARNPCKQPASGVYGRGGRKTVEVKLVDGKWTEPTFHLCHGVPELTAAETGGRAPLRTSWSAKLDSYAPDARLTQVTKLVNPSSIAGGGVSSGSGKLVLLLTRESRGLVAPLDVATGGLSSCVAFDHYDWQLGLLDRFAYALAEFAGGLAPVPDMSCPRRNPQAVQPQWTALRCRVVRELPVSDR